MSGKWCYGNLQIRKDDCYIITPDETLLGTYEKVDRNTVGQFTGLKDKNGKEVYEGDIIRNINSQWKKPINGVVEYGEFNCDCCAGVYGWYVEGGDIRKIESCEVIGNVFENPELVKEE